MEPVPPSVAPYYVAPPTDLPYDDGEPLESPWHRAEIGLLIGSLAYHWRDRKDFFAGGNMFIHFSTERVLNRDFRGPDFFCVKGVERDRPRRSWIVWEEGGRYPDVIVELLSPSTAEIDRTVKKQLYEQTFRTPEYFCYDPDARLLEGWHLSNGGYEPIEPEAEGRMWSRRLELYLGTWQGTYDGDEALWLRFFDVRGQLIPTMGESQYARAEAEARTAAEARILAEAAEERARAAEAEIERLRRELEALRRSPPPSE